jgi:hypothetical protein
LPVKPRCTSGSKELLSYWLNICSEPNKLLMFWQGYNQSTIFND